MFPDMDQDWRQRAACKNADPRLFDPPEREPQHEQVARYAKAATFCWDCPVRKRCLAEARANRDVGFRGGKLLVRSNQSAADAKERATVRPGLAACGTWAAFKRHKRHGEEPCEPCVAASHEHYRLSYTPNPPDLRPCGTPAAYRRHIRAGEKACQACLGASRRLRAEQRAATGG